MAEGIARESVIDIGSNSVRLMVAEKCCSNGGMEVKPIFYGRETTRLIEGMRGGLLTGQAIERTAQAVCKLSRTALQNAQECRMFATSAVRDAENAGVFLDRVRELCGLGVDVLSGEREAYLALVGAQRMYARLFARFYEAPETLEAPETSETNIGVIDIGGGSMEIITGPDCSGEVGSCVSLPLGAIRMMQAYPPEEPDSISAVRNYAHSLVSPDKEKFEYVDAWICIGGTMTTLAAIDMCLAEYDRSKITGHVLSRIKMEVLLDRMCSHTTQERKEWAGMEKDRADILPYGLAAVLGAMDALSVERMICSDVDNLEGYLLAYGDEKAGS